MNQSSQFHSRDSGSFFFWGRVNSQKKQSIDRHGPNSKNLTMLQHISVHRGFTVSFESWQFCKMR